MHKYAITLATAHLDRPSLAPFQIDEIFRMTQMQCIIAIRQRSGLSLKCPELQLGLK